MVSKLIQCGLKAQVFHSPGQRPGYKVFTDNAPCKGNFNITLFFTVALTGRVAALYPFTQGVALGYEGYWAFSPLCFYSCLILL